MKKALYIDCSFGISGDMFVAALASLNKEAEAIFLKYSNKLEQLFGIKASLKKVSKQGIQGFILEVEEPEQRLKNFNEFVNALKKLELSEKTENLALEILSNLASAESKVHGVETTEVHFHELGNLDTLLDAVLASALISELGIEVCFSSSVGVGSGVITTEHGVFSVPAPATAELLKGMPLAGGWLDGERTTPTGASILKSLQPVFLFPDDFYMEDTGYGFGAKEFQKPDYLRVFLGWVPEESLERIYEASANIDDLAPQTAGAVISLLLKQGALDAWIENILMKKGRPGYKISFLCYEKDLEALLDILFKETTTLGVRYHPVFRKKLKRQVKKVFTRFGTIEAKISETKNYVKVIPEYDQCLKAAMEHGVPIETVKKEVELKALKDLSSEES